MHTYIVLSHLSNYRTALDCAAEAGAVKCAELLLLSGAPVDPKDRTESTPLHLAATHGHAR